LSRLKANNVRQDTETTGGFEYAAKTRDGWHISHCKRTLMCKHVCFS